MGSFILNTTMKGYALCLLALAVATQAAPSPSVDAPTCYPADPNWPWIYVASSSAWFTVDFGLRTWTDSKAFCETIGTGVHIASIINADESVAIQKLYDNDAWIGGYSNDIMNTDASHSTWKWAFGPDGTPDAAMSGYFNWEAGQPSGSNTDYTAYYIRADLRTGEWDDKGSPDREEIVVCGYRC